MSNHAPIYSTRELVALLTEHDREHPDHGNECTCRQGLIKAIRILLASKTRPVPVVVNAPRPYVPPDVLRGTTKGER